MEQQVIYVEVYSIQHYVIKFVSDNKPNHNTTKYCVTDDDIDKPNHNTSMCCVYWRTTTMTNSTIIRPHIIYVYWMMTTTTNPTIRQPHIVFTDGWQQWQIQPYYDYMLCLLTGDNDTPNHNTNTCCVYWRTTTTTNPTIILPHIVCWQTTTINPMKIRSHIILTGRWQQQ
jgi:hypothetical protein